MRAAFGGGAQDFGPDALDRLQNNYRMVEGQLVEQDLAPHKEIADRLHARGMKAIYNVEAIWINSGFNVNADISGYRGQLQAIKNAGWDAAISEGLSQKQVSVIRSIIPYINEGGEQGENVYSGGMYYRPTSMADGNYLECYHFGVNYDPAFSSANQSTPDNMGMTFMLYTTASLEMNPAALTNYVDSLLTRGVKIKTMTFWVGFGQSALNKLDSNFNFLWNALNNKYGFTREEVEHGDDDMVVERATPAMVTVGNDIYTFVRGTDKALWCQKNDEKWVDLGGKLDSGVGATAAPDGTIHIVVSGTDGHVYRILMNSNGTFGAWAENKKGGMIG